MKYVILFLLFSTIAKSEPCSISLKNEVSLVGECYSTKYVNVFKSVVDFTCRIRDSKKYEKASNNLVQSTMKEHNISNLKNLPYCLGE